MSGLAQGRHYALYLCAPLGFVLTEMVVSMILYRGGNNSLLFYSFEATFAAWAFLILPLFMIIHERWLKCPKRILAAVLVSVVSMLIFYQQGGTTWVYDLVWPTTLLSVGLNLGFLAIESAQRALKKPRKKKMSVKS